MKKRRKIKRRKADSCSAEKKLRLLDEHDARGYVRDLEYLARLSFLSDSTRSWIEVKMYELREKANVYEHLLGEQLLRMNIDFVHQAPFVFRPKSIYFCDFYLPSKRVVIEVDGIYHKSPEMLSKDLQRDENFKSIGIRVIRIANEETRDKERLPVILGELLK